MRLGSVLLAQNSLGQGVRKHSSPRHKWGIPPRRLHPSILFVKACVKQIFVKGRDYVWPRPSECSRCNSVRIWGHGYVRAYFDGYTEALFLKRYRCPDCGCVYKMRPASYFSRFQASKASIRQSISSRLLQGRWNPGLPRSRQRHWLSGLVQQIRFHLGPSWHGGLLEAFDLLVSHGVAAVSRCIQSASPIDF